MNGPVLTGRSLFNQSDLTTENLRSKSVEFAQESTSVDVKALNRCLDADMSLGLILKDVALAAATDVTETPTLFINGRRFVGEQDEEKLRSVIVQEIKTGRRLNGAVSQISVKGAE